MPLLSCSSYKPMTFHLIAVKGYSKMSLFAFLKVCPIKCQLCSDLAELSWEKKRYLQKSPSLFSLKMLNLWLVSALEWMKKAFSAASATVAAAEDGNEYPKLILHNGGNTTHTRIYIFIVYIHIYIKNLVLNVPDGREESAVAFVFFSVLISHDVLCETQIGFMVWKILKGGNGRGLEVNLLH